MVFRSDPYERYERRRWRRNLARNLATGGLVVAAVANPSLAKAAWTGVSTVGRGTVEGARRVGMALDDLEGIGKAPGHLYRGVRGLQQNKQLETLLRATSRPPRPPGRQLTIFDAMLDKAAKDKATQLYRNRDSQSRVLRAITRIFYGGRKITGR